MKNELLRPQFHFTAETGWLNDPNGCVYYQGEWHLFFQHSPRGAEWGNMTWGHAVSTDLVHWQQLPNAIEPDSLGAIYSGSAAIDWDNTAGLGTEAMIAAFTYAGEFGSPARPYTQALACSIDKGRSLVKFADNPVVGNISGGGDRDPKVLWHPTCRHWVMVLYLDRPGDARGLAFFTSPDLKAWTLTQEIPGFYECPDFFELHIDGTVEDTRWVLMDASGTYVTGRFDGRRFTPESRALMLDNGANYYGPQTWNDVALTDGRRIQIAWMRGGAYPGMPFSQQMTFPCELALRRFSGKVRLCKRPIREISLLYDKELVITDTDLTPGKDLLGDARGDLFHVTMEIERGAAERIVVGFHDQVVTYTTATHSIESAGRTAELPPSGDLVSLELLIDRTSVEVFGSGGAAALSSCFLPAGPDARLRLCAEGGTARVRSCSVHSLRSALGGEGT